MEIRTFLGLFYKSTDLVCLFLNPAPGRRQWFVPVSLLKSDNWQRFLKAVNDWGSNVYGSVYPFACKRSGRTEENVTGEVDRVYLDFDEEKAYLAFRSDYTPVFVIQTSPGKYQSFLKLAGPVLKEKAKAIARGLAAEYGADHAFDLARVFRLPGFYNTKYSEKPLARVVEYDPEVKYRPEELPVYVEPPAMVAERGWATALQRRIKYGYDHFLAQAPAKTAGGPDYSSADFSYCIYLFSRGAGETEARAALLRESPNIRKRKGGGLENYLSKTISRAHRYQLSQNIPVQDKASVP